MVIKKEIAFGIVGGLRKFWKNSEFQDFTVKVADDQFECHRVILSACSEFFIGLFRSRMRETEEKSVTLKDIPSDAFKLILESIYTGHGVLTNDNVCDVWKAAHQLQIKFLVSECENFIINTISMENYAEYFYTGNILNSAVVLETLWPFVLKNCNNFFQKSYFLHLPLASVLRLIQSQDLETDSEDDVIHAILRWVEFRNDQSQQKNLGVIDDGITDSDKRDHKQEHESDINVEHFVKKNYLKDDEKNVTSTEGKKLDNSVAIGSSDSKVGVKEMGCDHLLILLSHARLCLASQQCLQTVVTHSLVSDNKEARGIVIDALLSRVVKGNGQWPSRAVHRNNSDSIHCLVHKRNTGNDVAISVYSLSTKKWIKLPGLVNVETMKLAAVDNKLYALCSEINLLGLSFFELMKGEWSKVNLFCTFESKYFHCAVVDSFVFIFSVRKQTVWKLDVMSKKLEKMEDSPEKKVISFTVPYEQCILALYSSTDAGVEKTLVQCYDTIRKTWRKLNTLEGSANRMTSFKDDHFTYLLQSNGNLWKVVKPQSDTIDFEFVVKLWNIDWPLYGAVTLMDELYIHGAASIEINNNPHLRRSLPGVFCNIHYLVSNYTGNAQSIPITLGKNVFD